MMGTPDDAKSIIREAEEDVSRRKYHYQWTQTYGQAADALEASGFAEEAAQARWMAYLMLLPFKRVNAEAKPERSWFVAPTSPVDGVPDGVTDEMLDYFAARSQDLTNPIIKVRCCEIIWSTRTKQHDFARAAVDTHIEAARLFSRRAEWILSGVHLSRAIGLAKLLNGQDKVQEAKNEWKCQLKALSGLSAPGAFWHLIDLEGLLGKAVSGDERKEIAQQCESIAAQFTQDDQLSERNWLKYAGKLYHKMDDSEAERRCLLGMAQALRRHAELYIKGGGFLYAIHPLEEAWEYYSELGPEYSEHADDLRIMLSEAHGKAMEQMPYIEASVKLEAETVESCKSALSQMSLHNALASLFNDQSFIPRIQEVCKDVSKMAESVPLYSLLPTTMLDGRNTVARAEPGDSGDHHLFEHMGLRWQPMGSWLTLLASTIHETHAVTPDDFSFLLPKSLMEPSRKALVDRGLERYIAGDFISALHILVPQFEACIRELLRSLGRPTSRPKRGSQKGLSQERLLDEMLREPKVRAALGDDLWYFYRFVFSDQRGWKIRHEICHGLADETKFNAHHATVIVYALISLGWLDLPGRQGTK